MAINRLQLIRAITTAQKCDDYESYDELLTLYYKMLSQEEINNKYLDEFIVYFKITDKAKALLEI